jgi:hypothetical protein
MFANPQRIQPIRKEDFVKVLPRREELFRSLGLTSSTVESLEAKNLDAKYVLAKVNWKMRFERETEQLTESQNSATYILSDSGDTFQIVFQIDHQDLIQRVRDMGLSQ